MHIKYYNNKSKDQKHWGNWSMTLQVPYWREIREQTLLPERSHPNNLLTGKTCDHSEFKIKTNQIADITDSAQVSLHAGLLSRLIC